MNNQHNLEYIVPLNSEAHRLARLFASEQISPQKGKKVYLNTLAVWAVHTYLKWLDIETDACQSYIWQPGVRATFDVTDLLIPGVGRLECRPIAPDEATVSLPGEMAFSSPDEVIGYIAVQFHENLDSVELVGFLPAAEVSDETETVSLSALKSLDSFLNFLPSQLSDSKKWHKQFIERLCEIGWDLCSSLTAPLDVAPASVGSSQTMEKLRWVINLEETVSLSVWLMPIEETERTEKLLLEVTPNAASVLPLDLELALISSEGETLIHSRSKEQQHRLTLKRAYIGAIGDYLHVRVSLGRSS